MERLNVFIDKEKIDKLFNEEKYKNCMEKKYFEYVVSNGKIDYIDKYLKDSKNRKIIESLVFKNKVVTIIDRLSVRLEDKRYIGELENSGIDDIEISKELIDNYHNQILTKGIFSLIKLEENMDKKYQYYVKEIEVLEDMNISLEEYKEVFSEKIRKKFYLETDEEKEKEEISGIDLVLNTIGISTKELTFWEKILFLVRLIPLCESNYNLMELGGNGIGKTKTYSMFSPECEIVQEMLTTELIYNRQSKIKGLLDTKDVIVFDEINKIKLDGDKEKIVPQLLNFMSEGQTTAPRKVISKTSLVFSGNVMGIEERIEKKEKNVFDFPHKLEDNAFLDRIHFFLPAWGLRRYSKKIHGLEASKEVFRFDYFSKVLSLFRNEDYSDIIDKKRYIIEGNGQSEREVKAVRKTVSGLIKLTHPDKDIDGLTLEAYIAIAIKGRGLVNKFLNNKNKNNVNKIDIKVKKRKDVFTEYEEEVPVNESLKELISINHLEQLNKYFPEYEEDAYTKITSTKEKLKYNFSSNFLKKKLVMNKIFLNKKNYPNRQIVVFNNEENKGELVFIKFALDKVGISRNKREKKVIKEVYKSEADLIKDDRILIFVTDKKFSIPSLSYKFEKEKDNKPVELNYLYDDEELNYDQLFGDDTLDENEFTGTSLEMGTRKFEADLSNIYAIDKEKKLKCEDGDYIIPKFLYSRELNKYYYEDSKGYGSDKKISEKMTYVEFKYFLANNGFIELN